MFLIFELKTSLAILKIIPVFFVAYNLQHKQ